MEPLHAAKSLVKTIIKDFIFAFLADIVYTHHVGNESNLLEALTTLYSFRFNMIMVGILQAQPPRA